LGPHSVVSIMCGADVFLAILAVFFPPIAGKSSAGGRIFLFILRFIKKTVATLFYDTDCGNLQVWIKRGICTADSIINIALCCLGYIPGLLHAWYTILKYPDPDPDHPEHEGYEPLAGSRRGDVEGGRATYYYVSRQPAGPSPEDRNYGAVSASQTSPNRVPSATKPAPREPQPEAGDSSNAAPGGSHPPPTYAEAVKGDHKVQTQD
jgi:uncharacterized membrane protein YqaE (UPF0057 family)